jgi:hypothetical protein
VKNARKRRHGQSNQGKRRLLADVSEAELIALGGVKKLVQIWIKGVPQNITQIVFGAPEREKAPTMPGVQPRETQLVFTPNEGAWKVALTGKPSLEEMRRELSKAGRGLWNAAQQKPDVAFQAVEGLLNCWNWFKGLPSDEQQQAHAQFAISATLQALERDRQSKGRKLQLAFALLTDDQWPGEIDKLLGNAVMLACELQRPPSKKELKNRFDPCGNMHAWRFTELLKHAGLAWLKRGANYTRGFF